MPKGMKMNSPRHNRQVKQLNDISRRIDAKLDRIEVMSIETSARLAALSRRLDPTPSPIQGDSKPTSRDRLRKALDEMEQSTQQARETVDSLLKSMDITSPK